MITLTDEQARQVRELLQYGGTADELNAAIAIIESALAQPEQEPVATIHVDGSFVHVQWRLEAPNECHLPVYDRPQISPDAEEVLADHRRLVRELDVLLNGDGAARQASLCDIVSQVRRDGIKAAPVAQPLSDEDFWQGVCESLDMELFGYRVSFNEGKTWTFWETDPKPSALASHPKMVVLPIYVKKYEHGIGGKA